MNVSAVAARTLVPSGKSLVRPGLAMGLAGHFGFPLRPEQTVPYNQTDELRRCGLPSNQEQAPEAAPPVTEIVPGQSYP